MVIMEMTAIAQAGTLAEPCQRTLPIGKMVPRTEAIWTAEAGLIARLGTYVLPVGSV